MLREALDAGRQPVLVAPKPCLDVLAPHAEALAGLITASSCDFPSFLTLLHEAEYAFYWNLLSASILGRVLNRGPFFLFDRGHLAQAIPAVLEVGLRHFYPGCRLELLDPGTRLDPDRLAGLAERQGRDVFGPALANLAKSPVPSEALRRIIELHHSRSRGPTSPAGAGGGRPPG